MTRAGRDNMGGDNPMANYNFYVYILTNWNNKVITAVQNNRTYLT